MLGFSILGGTGGLAIICRISIELFLIALVLSHLELLIRDPAIFRNIRCSEHLVNILVLYRHREALHQLAECILELNDDLGLVE